MSAKALEDLWKAWRTIAQDPLKMPRKFGFLKYKEKRAVSQYCCVFFTIMLIDGTVQTSVFY